MNETLPIDAKITLTNCDREPIQTPGGIQPLGFLLAMSADWLIQRAANTEKYLGKQPHDLLGTSLGNVFCADAITTLRAHIAMLRGTDAVERILGLALSDEGDKFDVAVHFSGNSVIIECEPATDDQLEASAATRTALARLSQCKDSDALLSEAARQFRGLLGYSRVMIYRFAGDESGEVVAQSVARGTDSFLGLHFPATDIPQQARKLYVRNTFRIIADAHADPVPIEPVGEMPPLDLSMALYRAVSPVHLEYLRNMGVVSSLSVSIIVEGRFWGLIACHHDQPKVPSFAERSAAELFGQIFSLQLESKLRAEVSEYEDAAQHVSNRLMSAAAQDESRLTDAEWLHDLMPSAIRCDGVGVYVDDSVSLDGLTPGHDNFCELIRALNRADAQTIHHGDRISAFAPNIDPESSPVAGFLAIPISRRPRDYMVLFRKEQIETVRWAGQQAKHVEQTPDGPKLSPRNSFDEWREIVSGRSEPFTRAEVRVAERLRTTLLEVVLRLTEAASEERRRAGEQQKLLIAELNHRVRNILALIRALMSQSRREGGSIAEVIDTLEKRVKALASAHDMLTAKNWSPASLRGLLETEVEAYIGPNVKAGGDRMSMDGPDVAIAPEAIPIMALVIHEMATNAAKYGALSDSGTLELAWHMSEIGDLVFDWRERGGPAVQRPTRQGFGTTVINNSIPHELGGEAEIHYRTSGVEARFTIPARHVAFAEAAPETPVAGPETAVAPEAASLDGMHMLLVEDSMLIAFDAEDKIRDMGAGEVTLAASVSAACEAIKEGGIQIAMLDFNLGKETSSPIARECTDRGIPFFFATGYGGDEAIPSEFAGVPVVVKPYTSDQIEDAILKLLGKGG